MELPPILVILCALIRISSSEQDFRCGLPHARTTHLIVSGQDTHRGLWPWHVALFVNKRNGQMQYACGGTLISRRYVLTAAHCVLSTNRHQLKRNAADITVWAGVYNLDRPEESQQTRSVKEIHLNGYSRDSFLHDIALLELQQPVYFNEHVLPACLNQKMTLRSELGTVVGWGYGEDDRTSPTLRKLTLPVVTETECLKSDPGVFKEVLNNELLCAGYANGSSPCNGDSGGGLVMQQGDAWHVAGIVSFTKVRSVVSGLCLAESYTAFTNVSAYWGWIENVTNIDFHNLYNEEQNAPCTTPTGIRGTCVPLQQCKDLFYQIRAPVISQEDANLITASICKISGIPRAVCCQREQIEPLPLHPNALLLPTECGRSLIRSRSENKQDTSLFEFPWMAMVRYQKKMNGAIPFCLGTLINQRYVLSMIGCMNKIKKVQVDHIRLGEHTEATNPDCLMDRDDKQFCARPVLDVKIESIVYHPLFDIPVYNNDVALIRMISDVSFTDHIQPVCLPLFSPHRSTIPEELFMTAWEMNLNKGNIYRGELRRYPNRLVSIDACQRAYENIGFIPDPPIQPDRMCSLPTGPEFNCELTPGAPIGAYVDMNGERFVQFGQWKFAPQNCTFRSVIPSLAMNMGYYLQWILENIEP